MIARVINDEDLDQVEAKVDKSLDSLDNSIMFDLKMPTYPIEFCNKLLNKCELIKSKHPDANISVNVEVERYCLPKVSDIYAFIEIEDELNKLDVPLTFQDRYSLDETITAIDNANKFLESLKAMDLSPFERFLMIYNYVASREYKFHPNEEEARSKGMIDPDASSRSRDLISILNNDWIVCVGYATLMQYLCEEEGIKCVSNGLTVYDKGKGNYLGGHQNNLVYINDEKYNINGWFYADACWDCIAKGKEPYQRYNYCLLPVDDIKEMKKDKIKAYAETPIMFFTDSKKELLACMLDSVTMMEVAFERLGIKLKTSQLRQEFVQSRFSFFKEQEPIQEVEVDEDKYQEYVKNLQVLIKEIQDVVIEVLKEEDVTADYFDANVCNIEFVDLVKYAISAYKTKMNIKEYVRNKINFYLERGAKFKNRQPISNIYAQDLKVNYLIDSDIEWVFSKAGFAEWCEIMEQAKNIAKNSTPIPIESFESGLITINMAQGVDEKIAKTMARRAIERTSRCAEKIFTTKAINCFSTEQLKSREQENIATI